MSPRDRRLLSDLRQMEELASRGEVTFSAEGNPPTVYNILLEGAGLAREGDGTLSLRNLHRCVAYLHLDYPRRPPVVTWLTPIFHPNILGPERNGGVCVGDWSASESLADLCMRLRDLLTFHALNATDALDLEAARWVEHHGVRAGVDVRTLLELPLATPVAVDRIGA